MGNTQVDAKSVKSYAEDLKNLLDEANISESKAFLRSFVKQVVIDGEKVTVQYNIPIRQKQERQNFGKFCL